MFFGGPESFTPDGVYHFGEAPNLQNFFIEPSMNAENCGTAPGIYTYDWQTIAGSHQLGPGAFHGAGRSGSFNYIRRETLFKLV